MANESIKQGIKGRNYGSTMGTSGDEIGFAGPSTTTGTGFFDAALFYRLCDKITSNIFGIAKHATSLEKTLKTIGTQNDTDTLRDSVHIVTTTALQTINETTTNLKQITSMVQRPEQLVNVAAGGKEEKMRVTRLTSDFQQTVKKFTDVQKQIVNKMKSTMLPSLAGAMMESEGQDEELINSEAAQQVQIQHQQQLEFEQGMLLERENRIRQIETDILDVNDIMKELACLVSEQSAAVDSIEGNIDGTYTQVEAGRSELQKAATYQSTYRKRLFCLLGLGLVVLIIVVIVLVTSLRN